MLRRFELVHDVSSQLDSTALSLFPFASVASGHMGVCVRTCVGPQLPGLWRGCRPLSASRVSNSCSLSFFLHDVFEPRCTEHIYQYFSRQLVKSNNPPKD